MNADDSKFIGLIVCIFSKRFPMVSLGLKLNWWVELFPDHLLFRGNVGKQNFEEYRRKRRTVVVFTRSDSRNFIPLKWKY